MTQKNRDFHEKCSLQASCSFWAALPGAPAPGKVLRPKDVSHMTRRAFLVLEYWLYVIQRQGRSVPKHVLHPCRSKIDFLYNSQKQYKNQYNLNFLFARQNSPREIPKKLCHTSAAKRTARVKVVARLRWF